MTIEFRHATLDNGLTVVGEIVPEAHTAAIGAFVRTGARDEAEEVMGVSHFLEHMMFKGTDRRSADQVNQQFDDIGANYNAFTSHEQTAFWAHVLPEFTDDAEDLLTDILRPSLRQDDFEQEKGVILEEIAMYADQPFWVLYENALERYYPEHPLRHRVLGTVDTIQNLTRDEMQAYFEQRYSADNTVIALAGAIDFDERVSAIEQRCGHWRTTGAERAYPPAEVAEERFTIELDRVARHYMLTSAPAPPVRDDDRYAAAMLGHILGDADGSRLYWSLIETGLADEAFAQYDGRDGVGEFYAYASCPPADADNVEQVLLKEMEQLPDSIDEDDLARVRAKVATAATFAGERPAGRMRRLGVLWTYTGEYRSLEDELARINAVTIDDLRRVAEAYPMTPKVIARLAPPAS